MKSKTQQEQTERTEMKEISLLTLLPPVQTVALHGAGWCGLSVSAPGAEGGRRPRPKVP